MIYIIRHREGDLFTNVLNKLGLKRSSEIVADFRALFKHQSFQIHTCGPSEKGGHIRPLQTASVIGTCMYTSVQFDIPDKHDTLNHHLIVWHHSGMGTLLKQFHESDFIWDGDNYDGCLLVNRSGWSFVPNFLDPRHKSSSCFGIKCPVLY